MQSVWHMVAPQGTRVGLPVEIKDREAAEKFFEIFKETYKSADLNGWRLVHQEDLKGAVVDRCDFCLSYLPVWVLKTDPMRLHGPIEQRIDSDWLACEPCKRAAVAENWPELVTRAVKGNLAVHPEWRDAVADIKTEMEILIDRFRAGWDRKLTKVEKPT